MNEKDSEKIIETMKAALKATKKLKSRKKKRLKKSDNNNSADDDDKNKSSCDEAIADLMNKSWKMKSPIVDQKVQKSPPKVKVNAFEKLMNNSKKIESISPEVQLDEKKPKRKYTKRKNKNQETEPEKIDPESDLSMLDEESLIQLSKRRSNPTVKSSPTLNGIQKFFSVKQESPSVDTSRNGEVENEDEDDEDIKMTRKRNRGKETNLNISIQDENTPKRRKKIKEDKVLLDSNENVEEIDSSQSSGRPKRSCANKINYSILESPDKQSPEKRKPRRRRIASSDDDSSFAVIEIDENSPVKERKNVKLAPLFVKKVPKPVLDPAVKEARRNFLFSTELPSNLRATIDKQKLLDEEILSNDLVAYPTISHITQLTEKIDICENISNSQFKFKEDLEETFKYKIDPLSLGRFTHCSDKKKDDSDLVSYDQPSPEDIKQIVRKIKESSGNFPVNRLFKQLLRKHKDASVDSEVAFHNSLFIDIFKPSTADEFLMAPQPIEKLKKFLTTWNDRNNKDDDFDSDSNSRSSFKGSMCNNYIVLSGNNGVGKTSSVYALANDLNYEVIEINAGSRRSGKKMLQDLYEATQSHRVEKRTEDSNSEQLDTALDKRTIILIEDAEIAFDSDDGFISSIQQLINITKRPVILTTNNRECPHLQRFIQFNEIIYESPQSTMITKYLTLLCLATASTYPHRRIEEAQIERLYSLNEYDLRKTINEIEFFIRSDRNSKRGGNLLEIHGIHQQARNKKPSVSGRKDLARRCFESSIISSYSTMISTFEKRELSHHSSNLMNEIADYFEHRATDFRGDFGMGGLRRDIKVKR
jgi:cytidylate kinase